MGFGEAIQTCLRQKYVTFQGRASRSEFWYFNLFIWICIAAMTVVMVAVASATGSFAEGSEGPSSAVIALIGVMGIAYLAIFLPALSVTVRRFHDRNMSGWWLLGFAVLSAIPFVGILCSIGQLVIFCLKGTEGPNRFGPDPLGTEYSADVFA